MFYDRKDGGRRRAERLPACHRASRDPAQTRARQSDSKFHAASPTRLPCLLHFRLPPPPHPTPPLDYLGPCTYAKPKAFAVSLGAKKKKTGAKKRFFAQIEENGREGALAYTNHRSHLSTTPPRQYCPLNLMQTLNSRGNIDKDSYKGNSLCPFVYARATHSHAKQTDVYTHLQFTTRTQAYDACARMMEGEDGELEGGHEGAPGGIVGVMGGTDRVWRGQSGGFRGGRS
jgi:hypothetical protein